MTNEETIEILNKINPFNDNSKMQEYFESVEIAINSIQENTKLKAEIEQLKSELEQSVKLPCKVGDTIYVNLPYQKPRNSYLREVVGFRYMDNSWFIETEENDYPFHNIGYSIFLTREEAEQSLKGLVSND